MAQALTKLKLRAIGNSTGVVIPKEILTDLAVEQGDEVFLVKTAEGYSITAYDADFEMQMEAAKEGMRQYRNALKELAK